jgi:Domain of unknown function (DUF4145)
MFPFAELCLVEGEINMEKHLVGQWSSSSVGVSSYTYICGYCGSNSGPSRGYTCTVTSTGSGGRTLSTNKAYIYLCPKCNKPTFINLTNDKEQVPGPRVGDEVEYLPEDIKQLYDEARNCISVNAFTSSVLACRKLLMNISVTKGAESDKSFAFYVNFLEKHLLPPNSKLWVDHIRLKGNEATHEINHMTSEDALELLEFTTMLLRIVFEMPGKMMKHEKKSENKPKIVN